MWCIILLSLFTASSSVPLAAALSTPAAHRGREPPLGRLAFLGSADAAEKSPLQQPIGSARGQPVYHNSGPWDRTASEAAALTGGDRWNQWMHDAIGMTWFAVFFGACLLIVPLLLAEKKWYDEKIAAAQGFGEHEDTFRSFLEYRFENWFASEIYAPALILCLMTVALIVTSALGYSLLVGVSPSYALWHTCVWTSGTRAGDDPSSIGRFIGMFVTVWGLIILYLLRSIMITSFQAKVAEVKGGVHQVVEGNHVVILGFVDSLRILLEEMSNAAESEGGQVFVLLSEKRKEDVEHWLWGDSHLNLRNSEVIVRSGIATEVWDLKKVAAGTASSVMVMADQSLCPEAADAKSIRTILALKTKGWPLNGRVVVQCCCEPNKDLLQGLYDKIEVVVVGDIIAKLMAQSAQMHGVASLFSRILGFEGDEFYTEYWPQLYGLTFKEVAFRFPDAVVLGIIAANGQCRLNPGWEHIYGPEEKLIVLAEDNLTYAPQDEAYFDYEHYHSKIMSPCSKERFAINRQRSTTISKLHKNVLIIGWNSQIAPLLESIDAWERCNDGTDVQIYSHRSIASRESFLNQIEEQRGGNKLINLNIKHVQVDLGDFSSRAELEKLQHNDQDCIFLLADNEGESSGDAADERTMAVLAQLQHLNAELPEGEHKQHFDPVVEVLEDSSIVHLEICGMTNFIHSNALVAQAMAGVADHPVFSDIFGDLMNADNNNFEFYKLTELLPPDETLSDEYCYGELLHLVSLSGNMGIVAWTVGSGAKRTFEINPKDKTSRRPWASQDRLIVIRYHEPEPAEPEPVKLELLEPEPTKLVFRHHEPEPGKEPLFLY